MIANFDGSNLNFNSDSLVLNYSDSDFYKLLKYEIQQLKIQKIMHYILEKNSTNAYENVKYSLNDLGEEFLLYVDKDLILTHSITKVGISTVSLVSKYTHQLFEIENNSTRTYDSNVNLHMFEEKECKKKKGIVLSHNSYTLRGRQYFFSNEGEKKSPSEPIFKTFEIKNLKDFHNPVFVSYLDNVVAAISLHSKQKTNGKVILT